MPEDILEAAQKVINDAAGITKEPGKPAVPTDAASAPVDAGLPPVEPAPEPPSAPTPDMEVKPTVNEQVPPTPPATESSVVSVPEPVIPASEAPPKPPDDLNKTDLNKTTVDSVIAPPSTADMPMADASQLVESILTPKNPDAIVPPAGAPPKHQSAPLPKRSGSGIIIAIIALLLLALPVGVYFVSQQNQQLADVRSKATGSTYAPKCKDGTQCAAGEYCHCKGGQTCDSYECVDDDWVKNVCTSQGRSFCQNSEHPDDNGWTCCTAGYSCCTNVEGCCKDTNPTNPPHTGNPTQPPENPTPTSTTIHECTNLKIYKNGVQVTPSSLRPDDNVVFAVKGSGSPNKARFRVNGAVWTESTTTNASAEYTQAYTVPVGVTDFVIEAEVFVDGVWK